MKKLNSFITFLFSILFCTTLSQFTVTQNASAFALAQQLAGSGVNITNTTLVCPTSLGVSFSGLFQNAPAGLGISDGVVLTTGLSTDLIDPTGINFFASTSATAAGDTDLDALLVTLGETYTTNDACVLEFDIEVTGDSLKFNYVMGSEEYPTFVCGSVNDIFGFFISGPNPLGGNYVNQNIALIPGTNVPVSINTVNNGGAGAAATCYDGTYSNFMNQNPTPLSSVDSIAYTELTKVFQAKAATVPCQTYHFKLAIADGGDYVYDSGVFLEAGSFTSNAVVIGASSVLGAGFNEAIEGCVNGVFSLELDTPYSIPVMVGYDISGTATNGIDYTLILDSVLVAPGDTLVDILISVINDGILEGPETVILTPYTVCGTLGSPSVLTIIDEYPHSINIVGADILCEPAVITLQAIGSQFYDWGDPLLFTAPDSSITQTADTIYGTTTFYMQGVLGTCSYTDSVTVVISQSDPQFVIEDISCAGANDGAYYIVPNDSGSFPFIYSFPFIGSTDSAINNLGPGFQFAQATDAFGCVFTGPFYTFADPAGLIFGFDSIPISCAGANDGQLCIYNIADGTYSLNIDTNGVLMDAFDFIINADTFCLGSLAPGIYDAFFINDTTGCSGSFTGSYTEPMGLVFSYDTTNVSCVNNMDGSICIYDVVDGPYTVNVVYEGVSLPPVNFNINSDSFCMETLAAGHYDINLVNNNTLCNANFMVDLNQADILIVNLTSVGASLCAGGSIDSLLTGVSGGTQAYQYLWNTAAVTPYLHLPIPGTYSVVVTDLNGCQDSASVTLVSPGSMYLDITMDSVLCAGDASGTAYIDSISGGTAPYTYLWDDVTAQTNDTASNILAGQLILTVLDFNACPIIDTIDVLEPNNPLGLVLTSNLITCFGGDTCIDATVSGGTTPYTFLWNDALSQTTEDICGLVAGTYTLTVTDAKGCIKIDSISILENAGIVLTMDSTNVICYGMPIGNATITAIGGSGAYNYLWDDGLAQTTVMANNLVAGTYTVIVSDQNNLSCSRSLSVTIQQPIDSILISLDSIQDILCFNESTGSIHLSVSGGTIPYTYAWDNGGGSNQDLTNEEAGVYTITVTDATAICSMSLTDSISQPIDSISIVLNTNVISCFGGDTCIDATVSGGSGTYTYLWNDALNQTTEDICGLVAGVYTLTVTDDNGCINTKMITITEVVEISLTIDSTNIDCFGDATGTASVIVIGGSGAYTYLWNDALSQTTAIATALVPGTYTVVVSDANDPNCTKSISVNIIEPDSPLSATLDNILDVLCFGSSTGEINVNITGGTLPYSYAWTNGSVIEDLNGASANTHTLTVTDNNNCITTYTDLITQPADIVITIDNSTPISCFGGNDGAIDVSVTGGLGTYTYVWNGGATSQDATGLAFGTHQVTVTDGNSCSKTAVIQLIQPADVIISFNYSDYNGVNVSCNGGVNGTVEAVVVSGGSTPFSYNWDNGMTGNPIAGIAANTAIIVTVTDGNLCSYSQAIIPLNEPTVLSLTKDSTNVSCAGYNDGAASATPIGGTAPYSYLWSNGMIDASISGLSPNTYTCNVVDANGCIETIQVLIIEADAIIVTTVADSVKCWGDADGVIIVNAIGGNGNAFQYSIDGGLTYQTGSVFTGLTAGVYTDIIVQQAGSGSCVSTSVSQVVNQPDPMFIFINPADTTIQIQESVPLTIMVDPATGYFSGGSYSASDITSIVWSPTIGLSCTDCINPSVLTYEQSSDYVATVTYSPYACVTNATATIQVENNLMYFVPNGFSPQGDGINDEFLVYGEALKDFSLVIFNRWGEKVFETNVQSQGWDGTFKGILQSPGVFTYYLDATYLDDKEISTKGSITLIR